MDITTIKNENGDNVTISMIGTFKVPDLNKEYIMYSFVDDNENNEDGDILIGEFINNEEETRVLGVKPEEEEMVTAYFNEVLTQLGE